MISDTNNGATRLLPATRVIRDGEPSPLTFVFLHCFGTSRREWAFVAARLADRFDSAAIDLPGFGDAHDFDGYDVESMARQVHARIESMRLARFVLVGHSMSGKIALVITAQQPANLAGVALVSPSPPGPEPMTDADRKKLMAMRRDRASGAVYFDGITRLKYEPDRRERAIDDFCRLNQTAWEAWLTGGSNEDWSSRVGTIGVPALLICGSKDPSLPMSAQRATTIRHLKDRRCVDLPGCGHVAPLEADELLADHLAAFARQL